MALMLKDVGKHVFRKDETFRSEIAIPLLLDRKGAEQEKRRVSSCAVMEKCGKNCRLKLFDTYVAEFRHDGGLVLDSGGWRTRYTRGVLEGLLPHGVHLYSEGGLWVLKSPHFDGGFADGCVVFEDGRIYNAMTKADLDDRRKLLKKAKRYCDRYITRLMAGKVEPPGPGDCFYCQVESGASKAKTGVLMPDGALRSHTFDESSEHIVHHIDEGYFVPSLLHNAIKDVGSLLMPARVVMQYCWGQSCKGSDNGVSQQWYEREQKYGETVLRRVLHKYLKKRLGCEFGGTGWQSRPS